jgi:hypothetical protein
MTDGKIEWDGENGVSRTAVSSAGHVYCRNNLKDITACYGPIFISSFCFGRPGQLIRLQPSRMAIPQTISHSCSSRYVTGSSFDKSMLLSDLLFPWAYPHTTESGCGRAHASQDGLVFVQMCDLVTLSSPLWSATGGRRTSRTIVWIEEVVSVLTYSQ